MFQQKKQNFLMKSCFFSINKIDVEWWQMEKDCPVQKTAL